MADCEMCARFDDKQLMNLRSSSERVEEVNLPQFRQDQRREMYIALHEVKLNKHQKNILKTKDLAVPGTMQAV